MQIHHHQNQRQAVPTYVHRLEEREKERLLDLVGRSVGWSMDTTYLLTFVYTELLKGCGWIGPKIKVR